jgi:hypothetical protein
MASSTGAHCGLTHELFTLRLFNHAALMDQQDSFLSGLHLSPLLFSFFPLHLCDDLGLLFRVVENPIQLLDSRLHMGWATDHLAQLRRRQIADHPTIQIHIPPLAVERH